MVTREWWIRKDLEEKDRGLFLKYYPGICLQKLRKIVQTSIRLAGLQAEIGTRVLLNTKQEC
jgi:hypothetical protein